MAKQKKKRNKKYHGADAAATTPSVTRVSAVNRNKVQQWWFEKKRIAKPIGIAIGVLLVIILIIVGLLSLV